jgi:hypothetical protein
LQENGMPKGSEEARREYVSIDPLTGQRKLVTIMERQLPSGPLRAQSPTQLLMMNGMEGTAVNGQTATPLGQQQIGSSGGGWTSPGRRLLASAYESRIVEVQPAQLQGLELEQICGWQFGPQNYKNCVISGQVNWWQSKSVPNCPS